LSLIVLEILLISVVAGIAGSILGLGGGTVITPALTLIFGIDIRYAIGASIISVIATSSGAAIAYVRDEMTNIRVAMFLEIATTVGAITGAFLGGIINANYLYVLFGLLLLYSAFAMFKNGKTELPDNVIEHPLAQKLKLNGQYYDDVLKQPVDYKVANVPSGFGVMYGAGIISGLLGIGSGSFKVMAMDLFMKLPMKISSATSNFMMGVTGAASAGVFFLRGDIDPKIAGPVALGVLAGATIGARIMKRMKNKTIRKIFIPFLVYIALQMMYKGVIAL